MWNNQEVIKRELAKHLGPEANYLGNAQGILTGVVTTYFYGIGKVEFILTDEERAEYLAAVIKSQRSWWGCSIAHYMSEELELLVCGNKPERYRIIEALS